MPVLLYTTAMCCHWFRSTATGSHTGSARLPVKTLQLAVLASISTVRSKSPSSTENTVCRRLWLTRVGYTQASQVVLGMAAGLAARLVATCWLLGVPRPLKLRARLGRAVRLTLPPAGRVVEPPATMEGGSE